MSRKRKIALFAGIPIVLAASAFALISRGGKSDLIEVQTAPVEAQKIVQTVVATGRIQPVTQINISADVSAKITRLAVKEGDWVERGQFLLELDRERYLAEVESAEANLRSSEADAAVVQENLDKAVKDLARIQDLHGKSLESGSNLDTAKSAVEVDKARLRSAQDRVSQNRAALKQSRDALSKTTIYAPIAGTVSKLNKEIGEIALGSQFQEDTILELANLSGMEALVDVDENDIVQLSLGDEATIEVDALPGVSFKGTVTDIASSAKIAGQGTTDQKTEFEVKVAILDPGSQLRPGMTASADIVTEVRESALGVPIQSVAVRTPDQLGAPAKGAAADSAAAAFTPDKDGFVQVVFVVENGVAHAKQVKTGIQSDTHIELLEGVAAAEQVVTGSYRAISRDLKEGAKVKVGGAEKSS